VDKQGLYLLNTVTFYIRILLQVKDEDGDRSLLFLSSWLMSWTGGGEEMTGTCELTAATNRAPYVVGDGAVVEIEKWLWWWLDSPGRLRCVAALCIACAGRMHVIMEALGERTCCSFFPIPN